MLNEQDLKTLRDASYWYLPQPEARERALDAIGRPSDDDVVASAIAVLEDADRNRRVAALRILNWHTHRPDAAAAVLRATHDPVRRVRWIAVDSVPVAFPGVAERLGEIVKDEREYHRIRGTAAMRLGRVAMLDSARWLLDRGEWRRRILFMLVCRPADDAAKEVLREIVRVGDKHEAVVATRALCGQRVVNTGGRAPSEDAEPADVGWLISRGMLTKTKHSVYFWVRS